MRKTLKKTVSLLLVLAMILPAAFISASAATTLVWPVPSSRRINQGFHSGCAIDIGDSSSGNATIVSATSGTVTNVFKCTQQHYGSTTGSNGVNCSGFGTGVVIKGPDGRFYGYAHMQANSIPSNIYVGATVTAGQTIGRIGSTGNSSGNHLHFQITTGTYYNKDSNINPENETYTYSTQSSYTLTYNANGGTGAPSSQTGTQFSISHTVPTRTGYTFLGWSESRTATSPSYRGGDLIFDVDSDITLYAVWGYNSFVITYDANGGVDAPASVTDSIITISRNAPYKFGYNFVGWSESRTASSAEYTWRSTLFEVRDRYLYAVWNAPTSVSANTNISTTIDCYNQYVFYTFTPSSSGEYVFESSGNLDTLIYLYDSSQTLLGEDDDEGEERNFKLSVNLTSGRKYYISIRAYSNNVGTSSFRITKETPATYTLSYNANGGSGAPSSQSDATSYTISSTVPERFGYTFLGWSKNSSATTATYEPDDYISLTSDTTLYAVWKSASTASVNTTISTTIEFPYQQVYYTFTPSSSGEYTFESSGSLDTKITVYNSSGTEIGYNDDGSENRNFLLTEELSSGTRYYVKIWAYSDNSGSTTFRITKEVPETYTLYYNANGGSGAPSSQSGATSYTVSSAEPTRSGYTFLGWSRSSSATLATYYSGDTISLTADTTLYAVWQVNAVTAYTLTYNANGGSGAPSSQSGATSYTVSSTEPTRNGYTFLGWSKSPIATFATYYAGNTITLTANTTLYAVWQTNVSNNTPEVHIRNNPGTRTINYGDIIHITAEVTNLPEGASIDWRISNDSVGLYAYLDDENEFSCYVEGTGSGSGYIVAVLVDADGNEILDENGNVIYDRQDFKVNGGFIQIIINFLKLIFGINRTIVQSVFGNNI